jgi:Ca2+-binding EF-hand superfamily protein
VNLETKKKKKELNYSDIENEFIDFDKFLSFPEFEVNPFNKRIFFIFSNQKSRVNGKKLMSFEDYLNMMSVFSEAAPVSIKSQYAFQIYGKQTQKKTDIFTLLKLNLN